MMLAKNDSRLAFSITNILQDSGGGDDDLTSKSASSQITGSKPNSKKKSTVDEKKRSQRRKSNKKEEVKEEKFDVERNSNDDEQSEEEIVTEIAKDDEEENNSSCKSDDDDEYEVDDNDDEEEDIEDENEEEESSEHSSLKQQSMNSKEIGNDFTAQQYKNFQEYYLNMCRNQMSGVKTASEGVENQVTGNSGNEELSKSLFRLLLASSSSPANMSPPLSSTPTNSAAASIYNNFLLQWLQASSLAAAQQQQQHQAPQPLQQQQQQPLQVQTSFDLTRGFLAAASGSDQQNHALLLEQKSQNYQKRIGHPYQNRNPPKRKKPRTSFNRPQIVELEKRFMKQKYLASSERSSLAKLLKMTDAQVKTWFQNRRTKWRRQNAEEKEAERQATNKLLQTLKQQQQQQQQQIQHKSLLDASGLVGFSNLAAATASLVGGGNKTTENENSNSNSNTNNSEEVPNPLNKLMMMEKVFATPNPISNEKQTSSNNVLAS